MKFLWKIGGEAGFGILTTGLSFSKMATRCGYHIFDYAEYPSLIKGGHNTYEVAVSDEEVYSSVWNVDILVCLNKDTYELHKSRLTPQSVVLYDPEEFEFDADVAKLQLPFKKFLKELVGPRLMTNTISLGASLAILDGDLNILFDLIEGEFGRKGEEVVSYNKRFAQIGFDHIKNNYGHLTKPLFHLKKDTPRMVVTANDTFSLGAVAADCRFYCAYPMSPSSSILTTLAGWAKTTGMVVRHAEDEISVINTTLGAAAAGARAACGSSGGGFALMVEAISFAGVAELPIVIFLGQRPGPATGLPTWTEQGDLLFATFAGHGEFPKIILAPGDAREMLEAAATAFDLADIYQTPVIVMSDKFLAESHKSESLHDVMTYLNAHTIDRGKTITSAPSPYLRYKIEEDGISPRLITMQKDMYYQSNSYEHEEGSRTTEDASMRRHQVDKRSRKHDTYLKTHFEGPKVWGDLKAADITFVGWGGTKGPILEARRLLEASGKRTAHVHFNHVFPLKKDSVTPHFLPKKRYVLVENNSTGQFGKLLQMETGIAIEEKILKYDGRPFYPEEIANYILNS